MYNTQFPGSEFQRAYYQQNVAFLENKPPEVVGEGDVVSSTSPDGSVLLYFLPMLRRNPYPSQYQANSSIQPAAPEVWYIRSICNTSPYAFFNNFVPNINPTTCNNNYFNSCNQHFQKFHNDNTSSTTDIHYFFPARYRDEKLYICAAVQVQSSDFVWCCRNRNKCNIASNDEHMCVDDGETYHGRAERILKSYKVCEACAKREKSNKLVATVTNTACGRADSDDGQTQTSKKYGDEREFVPRRSKQTCRCSSDCSCSYLT